MGASQSSPKIEETRDTDPVDSEFDQLWAKFSTTDFLTEDAFVHYLDKYDQTLTHSIFRFISVGNSQVTKPFMLSRFRDMMVGAESSSTARTGSYTAPFWTMLEVIHFSCREVIQIVCMDVSVVPEAGSLDILRHQVPNLENIFHSVIMSVYRDRAHPLDGFLPSQPSKIFDITIFRRMRLLLPITVSETTPDILFSSQTDGMSFRALLPKIKYYSGGVLFVFQSLAGGVFGCYADRAEWVDTQGFDESVKDPFMFQLSPIWTIRKQNRVGSQNFVYMNTAQGNGHPFGIGFGGREGSFRLWIDGSDLSKLSCMKSDATFEPGAIESESEEGVLEVRSLEVWGFGGNDALIRQSQQRESEESTRRDRRRVEKAKLVENQFDREVLFANTFKNQQAGSTRLVVWMASKRKFDNSLKESPKVIKGDGAERLSVGTHGTVEQRRTAATASVSADAIRFVPRQVRVKNHEIKN